MHNLIRELQKDVDGHLEKSREFAVKNSDDLSTLMVEIEKAASHDNVHIFTHEHILSIDGNDEEIKLLFVSYKCLSLQVAIALKKSDHTLYFVDLISNQIIKATVLLATIFAISMCFKGDIEKELKIADSSPLIAKMIIAKEFFEALCRKIN